MIMSSEGKLPPSQCLQFLIIIVEQLNERGNQGLILPRLRVMCLAIFSTIISFFLSGVLLLKDVEICIDAIIGDGLRPQQLKEVVPLRLESIILVVPCGDDGDEAVDYFEALLLHFNTNFDKSIINNITLHIQMFGLGLALPDLISVVEKYVAIDDPQVMPHLSNLLATIPKTKYPEDIVHLSNLVKQTQPRPHHPRQNRQEFPLLPFPQFSPSSKEYQIRKFSLESQKLQWAGYGLTREETVLIDGHLAAVAERYKAKEVRFWGKIFGTELDYYILQGTVGEIASLEETPKGTEKRGEGINYFTYWVANNLILPQWIQLPFITPQHIKIARKIKKLFSGHLDKPIVSQPPFDGFEKHYLKAQLVRMTHSLELVPKGILKPNDENPKVVEFEEEPKVPEFAELTTLESWSHRNQNVLNLGRCTHYIDPSLPEDQIQAATAELAEKDPQVERLRGITEDKLPQGSPFGVQNIWQVRVVGDTQIFQKDEASNVYGVVVLKNLYWPGWVTVGYKSGYSNFYLGNGHKWTQPGWNQYQNANLSEQADDVNEYHEPNPKQQPKPPAEPAAEEAVPEE